MVGTARQIRHLLQKRGPGKVTGRFDRSISKQEKTTL